MVGVRWTIEIKPILYLYRYHFENLVSQANEKLESEFEDFKENTYIEIRIGYVRNRDQSPFEWLLAISDQHQFENLARNTLASLEGN